MPTTRERIVESARHLFWVRGYERTSVAEILEHAGAGSGSLYHFFRSKHDLLLAVLARYLVLLDPVIVEPAFSRTEDPLGRIRALFDVYRDALLATGFAGGCPIGNLALEVSDLGDDVRQGIARNFAEWRSRVTDCLAQALPAASSEELDAVATFVLTVMEGGVMQARATRTLDAFDASVRQLEIYLHHLAGTSSR